MKQKTGIPASALDDKVKPCTAMGHPVERVAPGLLRESIVGIEGSMLHYPVRLKPIASNGCMVHDPASPVNVGYEQGK